MALNIFTSGVMQLVTLLTLIIGWFHRTKSRLHLLLFIYTCCAFIQQLFPGFIAPLLVPASESSNAISFSINIFQVLEFIIFYWIFFITLKKPGFRKMLIAGTISMFLAIVYYWGFKKQLETDFSSTGVIQLFLLLIPCLLYIWELLQKDSLQHIKQDPVFRTIIGLLIFAGSSIPLFLAASKTGNHKIETGYIYSINNLLYAFFFTCLITVFLCKYRKAA